MLVLNGGMPTSLAVRRVFWTAVGEGLTTADAAARAGVSDVLGRRWFRQAGGMSPIRLSEPSSLRLSLEEREHIAVWRAEKVSAREMARRLGRAPTTVTRELQRNSPAGRVRDYRGSKAQWRAEERAKRPKVSKLAAYPPLRDYVQDKLAGRQHWSPQQISARLRIEFPDDEQMQVSHEAIYQALYVQGRGGLRRELTACLRTGRAVRRPQRRAEERSRRRVPAELLISERPAEVADRAVPGHWEGDLVIGAGRASPRSAPSSNARPGS